MTQEEVAFDKASRTTSTEAAYLKRAEILFRRCMASLELPGEPDEMTFVYWLAAQREGLGKSSWRQYKASVRFWLLQKGSSTALEAADYLDGKTSSVCLEKTDRTSATRAKNLTEEEFLAFCDHILKVESEWRRYSALLHTWLTMGALTGLRPHEWIEARVLKVPLEGAREYLEGMGVHDALEPGRAYLVAGHDYLRVKNSKHTNGRAHGEFRHLDITDFSVPQKMAVAALCKKLSDRVRYRGIYKACRKLLSDVNTSFYGKEAKKRVHLYSARHRFASEAKKLLSPEAVGAAMGHANNQTAFSMYGNARYSNGGVIAKPVDSEIARIRKVRRDIDFSQLKTPSADASNLENDGD